MLDACELASLVAPSSSAWRYSAKNNLLRGNTIGSDGDEGVHFRSGSGDNDFIDKAVFDLDGVRKRSVSDSSFATGSPGVLVGVVSGKASHRIGNVGASVP